MIIRVGFKKYYPALFENLRISKKTNDQTHQDNQDKKDAIAGNPEILIFFYCHIIKRPDTSISIDSLRLAGWCNFVKAICRSWWQPSNKKVIAGKPRQETAR
ncbi:Uncharacterised protein [uncultured archaeon]|nr:Uncharacterised protein [uncultured archaeon]